MADNKIVITFLGTRGSIAASGVEYNIYGGATTCLLLNIGGQNIILDAGTGIMNAVPYLETKTDTIPLLLTHSHIDHIVGLTCYPLAFNPNYSYKIMATYHSGLSVHEQIDSLLKPPIWPVTTQAFSPRTTFTGVPESSFNLGVVQVDWIEGNHPSSGTIFKFSYGGKSFVFATDFEHTEKDTPRLVEFAKNTDLLIYDGHFTDEEYVSKIGWGHSTWQEGIRIANRCGAKRLILTHHHPLRTDSELESIEHQLKAQNGVYSLAKAKEEVVL